MGPVISGPSRLSEEMKMFVVVAFLSIVSLACIAACGLIINAESVGDRMNELHHVRDR